MPRRQPIAGGHDDRAVKKVFKTYPIGYFHIDIAEVRTEDGKLSMLVAIDRTSKLAAASPARVDEQFKRHGNFTILQGSVRIFSIMNYGLTSKKAVTAVERLLDLVEAAAERESPDIAAYLGRVGLAALTERFTEASEPGPYERISRAIELRSRGMEVVL